MTKCISSVSKLSDGLLLEPQPWKCYMNAARRMRKLNQAAFEHLDKIKHRQSDLEPFVLNICKEQDFVIVKQLGETSWKRRIYLLLKADTETQS